MPAAAIRQAFRSWRTILCSRPSRGLLATSSEQADPVEFRVGNEPWLARISSIGFSDLLTGHRIVIAAPITDFTEASAALLRKTLSIASTLVLAGILVALLISRRISRALTALTADANRIGDLDFQSRPLTHSWISEINTLARALSSARDAIKTFAVYVPRELVRKIVASGQDEAGAAVRREVTVLFTDIRDFTTISEQHSPEAVVDMLSAYFQAMNVVVQRHNGVIVQYLGNSIYAMWNAPAENPHHVEDGCRCTLALKAAIDAFNAANAEAGRPELITRYGLHTGIAVVGSVGAAERRQYTAMGDTVNVASRLEGMNKQFGTTILASAAIRQRAENLADVAFRPAWRCQRQGPQRADRGVRNDRLRTGNLGFGSLCRTRLARYTPATDALSLRHPSATSLLHPKSTQFLSSGWMTDIEIRHVRDGDVADIQRILEAPHVVRGTMRLPFHAEEVVRERIRHVEGTTKLVAVREGGVAGYAELVTHPGLARHRHAGEINMIATHPDHRGHGIGEIADVGDDRHG